jgi:CRP-like cAMP-binding protein
MNLGERVDLYRCTIGFQSLSQADLEFLAARSFLRQFNKGEIIFHEGDPADLYMVVAQGRVTLKKNTPSGKYFTAFISSRGDTLNAAVLFDCSPRFFTAQALDKAIVVCLKKDDFISFVLCHPVVAVDIIKILHHQIEALSERLMDLISEPVEQRLLNILLMLANKFGADLIITNSELADLVGTTTETTIRIIGQLKKRGIITSRRGRVVILNQEYLRHLGRGAFWI